MNDVRNDIVSEISSKVNIVDVVSSYITLNKKGKDYIGICPFHDDSNPSMHVSPEKQIYKCFSCGAGGNVFNFVENYEHVSFVEALKILGDKYGIDTNVKITKKKDTKDIECYETITKFYENSIFTNKGKNAIKYLNDRGIDDKTIKDFRIGYAPSDDVVTKMLASKNYDYNTLVDIGITNKTDYGYKDFFYNRIIFPIANSDNKIVAASGRIFNGEDLSKYINTKETSSFKKGSTLYNYYQARDYVLKEKYVIVTEGFFDVIRCHIAGFKNTVATMGTALTKEHIKLLRKLSTNIILLFDGDSAGAAATFKNGNILMENDIIPKVVRLKENLDPDEFILKYGSEEFKKLIDNPLTFMEFKLDYLKNNKDLTKISDISSYVNEVIVEINKITDPITKDITIDKIVKDLGIDKSIITSRLSSSTKEKKQEVINVQSKKMDKYDKACYKLLYYMLQNSDIIMKYKQENVVFPNADYRSLANEILYFYKNSGTISSVNLITQLGEKKNLVDLVADIELNDFGDEVNMKEIDDCILLLKKHNMDMEKKRLQENLKKELDISKKEEIFQKMVDLRKREL